MVHKTELIKVTVEDLDGEAAAPPPPVNILRERTFNPELSTLLNKIYSHEKTGVQESPVSGNIDPLLKIKLLQKCDDLLYRLKHRGEASTITSGFNPFSLDINVYDDVDDLNDYIQAGMRQSGFSRFLIMKYNFKDAAFRTELNRIDGALTSDLFFSTRDNLFRYMFEQNRGVIIDRAAVASDPFIHKKLGDLFRRTDIPGIIYFVRLSSICDSGNNTSMIKKSMSSFEEYLSPVLAVVPDAEMESFDESLFFKTLSANMSIPFSLYIMKNRINFDSRDFHYEEALLMLELFMSSPAGGELTRSILTLDDFSRKENIFILKHLLARIKKRLEKNSFFMRISIDKCLLIASEEERRDIVEIIDELNISDKIFSIESVEIESYADRNSFAALFL